MKVDVEQKVHIIFVNNLLSGIYTQRKEKAKQRK